MFSDVTKINKKKKLFSHEIAVEAKTVTLRAEAECCCSGSRYLLVSKVTDESNPRCNQGVPWF